MNRLARHACRAVLAALIVPATGATHTVQLAPSVCAVDPFGIEAPRRGVATVVASPGAADQTRILYTTGSNIIQFEAPAASARPFALGASQGTVLLPTDFQASMTAAGDIVTRALPLDVEVDGMASTMFVRFSTGLEGAGDSNGVAVAEGSPVAADGTFTLVGISAGGDSLPSAVRDVLVFRLTCRAQPPPDLDQFAPVARVGKLSGSITPSAMKLRLDVRAADAATPDFAASRAIARVTVGDATVATALVPTGLASAGRARFAGGPLSVKLGRRRSAPSFSVTIEVANPTLPAIAGARAAVAVTLEVAGILARATREFRVTAGGTRLRAR